MEPKLFLHVPGSQMFFFFNFWKKNYFFKGAHQPDFILEQQTGIIIENKKEGSNIHHQKLTHWSSNINGRSLRPSDPKTTKNKSSKDPT